MKTQHYKFSTYLPITILISIIFQSCATFQEFDGNRVQYDFYNKKIKDLKDTSKAFSRPLVVKENQDIQIEVCNFNPLRYDILIHDSAYNRFDPNIESFSKFIVVPASPTNGGQEPASGFVSDTSKEGTPCSDSIKLKEKKLKEHTAEYKKYLEYVELINSYYKYLRSLEKWPDKSVIAEGITTNILKPVNTIAKTKFVSPDKVFESDFSKIEYKLYESIKKTLEETKNIMSDTTCKDFKELNKLTPLIKKMSADIHKLDSIRIHKILPEFAKTMMVYGRLQNLIQNKPLYVSNSIPIMNDVHHVKIFKFNHATGKKELHDEVRIRLTGGFRLNVSTGFFFSNLYDSKYKTFSKDSIYTYRMLSNDTIIDTTAVGRFVSFVDDSGEKFSYGGMVFFNGHTENARKFNYGGYIGIGAIFNDQTRWAASLGASLLIGTSQRLFINLGYVFAQVDRLEKPYKKDTFYLTELNNAPISRVWKSSWMGGISWKIAK